MLEQHQETAKEALQTIADSHGPGRAFEAFVDWAKDMTTQLRKKELTAEDTRLWQYTTDLLNGVVSWWD